MAANFNLVVLAGNMTRDPELRYTPGGTAVVDIGLAINDKRKDSQGEWIEDTTFVDVTLWARTAEVCNEYCKKGSPVLIQGRLKLDQWEDKETGNKRSKLKVVGERLQLLGSKGGGRGDRDGNDEGYEPEPAQQRGGGRRANDDDIPF